MTQFRRLNIFQPFLCGQVFVLVFLILLNFCSDIYAETGFTGISFQGIDARAAAALGLTNKKGVFWRGPGYIGYRNSADTHSLNLPEEKTAWTLMFVGPNKGSKQHAKYKK